MIIARLPILVKPYMTASALMPTETLGAGGVRGIACKYPHFPSAECDQPTSVWFVPWSRAKNSYAPPRATSSIWDYNARGTILKETLLLCFLLLRAIFSIVQPITNPIWQTSMTKRKNLTENIHILTEPSLQRHFLLWGWCHLWRLFVTARTPSFPTHYEKHSLSFHAGCSIFFSGM